ncbi:hypothetical protein ONS96_013753 [Cadophora gregata f. sp. sojae]|nr:hypothetical protein ONS96_013753 [Cadophora gregata f. sp. sojae]
MHASTTSTRATSSPLLPPPSDRDLLDLHNFVSRLISDPTRQIVPGRQGTNWPGLPAFARTAGLFLHTPLKEAKTFQLSLSFVLCPNVKLQSSFRHEFEHGIVARPFFSFGVLHS